MTGVDPDGKVARVAAIVVNWNGADDTIACLDGLAAARPSPWRVYVVDNASTDDSPDRILAAHAACRLLRATENHGYAAGFNWGRQQALQDGADYLWLLNNDTRVEPDALAALLQASQDVENAILAPLILRQDRSNQVWSAGGYLDWRLKSHHLPVAPVTTEPRVVQWATGCSLFCSAQVARLVGPMDERYFLYLEDVDWCLRARAKGVLVYLVPRARIHHGISRSTDRLGSPSVWYYAWRNYYLLAREHGCWWQRLYAYADLSSRFLKIAGRYIFFPSFRQDPLYRARARGLLDFVLGRFGPSLATLSVDRRADQLQESLP
jgi:GT2 family glycosyltransferase